MLGNMKKHIVVIGGGLAGTAASHQLNKYGYNVTIIERENYLGGRICTRIVDGEAIELGAGFLTKGYRNLLTFLRDTELETKLHHQHGKSGIYRNGDISMIALNTILNGKILSWGATLHAVPLLAKTLASWNSLDMHACYKADAFDGRSVTDSLTDRYSKELLEYIIQPALNGYFYWAPEHTSEAILFILCKTLFSHKTYKMKGGLQRIPEKAAESSSVLLDHTVKEVAYDQKGYTILVKHNDEDKNIQADGIVCATTASVVPRILPDLTKIQQEFFERINYSSTTLLDSTYEQGQIHENQSIAFPRQEGIYLSAITLSRGLNESGAPLASVKIYASGEIAKELGESEDKAVVDRLINESTSVLNNILIANSIPTTTHVHRWPEALPYFDVGHFKRLRAFADGKIEDQRRPLVFAGDYIGGPFMEGAFTSGLRAAERLHLRFNV